MDNKKDQEQLSEDTTETYSQTWIDQIKQARKKRQKDVLRLNKGSIISNVKP